MSSAKEEMYQQDLCLPERFIAEPVNYLYLAFKDQKECSYSVKTILPGRAGYLTRMTQAQVKKMYTFC